MNRPKSTEEKEEKNKQKKQRKKKSDSNSTDSVYYSCVCPTDSSVRQRKKSVIFEYSHATTSDDFTLRKTSLNLRNHRRDSAYAFEDEEESSFNFGIYADHISGNAFSESFEGILAMPFVAKKISSNLLIEGGIGYQEIESSTGQNKFIPFYTNLNYQFEQLYFSTRASRKNNLNEVRFPAAYNLPLSSYQYDGVLLWTPGRIRVRGMHPLEKFSDENDLHYSDLDLKYNFSFGKYWLLAGLGGEYLENSRSSSGYWNPARFYSYGPRFELGIPFLSFLHLDVAANLNWFKEESFETGFGHYANISI